MLLNLIKQLLEVFFMFCGHGIYYDSKKKITSHFSIDPAEMASMKQKVQIMEKELNNNVLKLNNSEKKRKKFEDKIKEFEAKVNDRSLNLILLLAF